MILIGDALMRLKELPDQVAHSCVTSPPYWGLRDYGMEEQIGLETTPEEFVESLVHVFREVRRVLRDDGTLWLNLGDSYAGSAGGWQGKNGARDSRTFTARIGIDKRGTGIKPKDLVGIPWLVAFALRADGWYLRQDIIWAKGNPMPESVEDRCTKAHEYLFLLSKSETYYFDHVAIRERATYPRGNGNTKPQDIPGDLELRKGASIHKIGARETRNKRSVWSVNTQPFDGAHFATFPPNLIKPCILAGSMGGGVILDPFFGAGTTGVVATALGRSFIGIELNPEYARIAEERIKNTQPGFSFAGGA